MKLRSRVFRMEPEMRTTTAEAFWKDLYEKSTHQEIPLSASLELTYQCNLHCLHCYISEKLKSEAKEQGIGELSYRKVCFILDQLADLGCFHLNLSGGEPLTRPDFFQILTYAKRKGFYTILLTNATLITPRIANSLRDLSIDQVDISLYGVTPQTYEKITQIPGSFTRSLKGIHLLRQRNINISVKMMVMTLNLHEFAHIKEFAKNVGVRFEWDYLVKPRIDGSKEPLSYRISPETAIDLELRCYSHLSGQAKNSGEQKEFSSRKVGFFYCNAGKNSLAITPYGEMNICLEYRFPGYEVNRGTVAEGWRKLINYINSIKPSSSYQCKECELRQFCQWCPAVGLLEERDASNCNSYYRELARIRRERIKNDQRKGR